MIFVTGQGVYLALDFTGHWIDVENMKKGVNRNDDSLIILIN